MTANETVMFAKLQQPDCCLEIALALLLAGMPQGVFDELKANLVAQSKRPDLSDVPPPANAEAGVYSLDNINRALAALVGKIQIVEQQVANAR